MTFSDDDSDELLIPAKNEIIKEKILDVTHKSAYYTPIWRIQSFIPLFWFFLFNSFPVRNFLIFCFVKAGKYSDWEIVITQEEIQNELHISSATFKNIIKSLQSYNWISIEYISFAKLYKVNFFPKLFLHKAVFPLSSHWSPKVPSKNHTGIDKILAFGTLFYYQDPALYKKHKRSYEPFFFSDSCKIKTSRFVLEKIWKVKKTQTNLILSYLVDKGYLNETKQHKHLLKISSGKKVKSFYITPRTLTFSHHPFLRDKNSDNNAISGSDCVKAVLSIVDLFSKRWVDKIEKEVKQKTNFNLKELPFLSASSLLDIFLKLDISYPTLYPIYTQWRDLKAEVWRLRYFHNSPDDLQPSTLIFRSDYLLHFLIHPFIAQKIKKRIGIICLLLAAEKMINEIEKEDQDYDDEKKTDLSLPIGITNESIIYKYLKKKNTILFSPKDNEDLIPLYKKNQQEEKLKVKKLLYLSKKSCRIFKKCPKYYPIIKHITFSFTLNKSQYFNINSFIKSSVWLDKNRIPKSIGLYIPSKKRPKLKFKQKYFYYSVL